MILSFYMFLGFLKLERLAFLQKETIRVPCILLKLDDGFLWDLYEILFAKLLCFGCTVSYRSQINKYIIMLNNGVPKIYYMIDCHFVVNHLDRIRYR